MYYYFEPVLAKTFVNMSLCAKTYKDLLAKQKHSLQPADESVSYK